MSIHKIVRVSFVLGAICLLACPIRALPVITNVVETGGDNEATDTIPAKWTGSTFPVSVANEPVPGLAIGNSFTVGLFGNGAPAFVDRNHRYSNHSVDPAAVPPGFTIPSYLIGGEYIMSGNDNRDNASYRLDVTVSQPVTAYMLIDNRLGDPNSPNTDPPTFGPTRMQWILDQGWLPSATGNNRTGTAGVPDEVPFDEGSDNTINQWYSVYRKNFPVGTFSLFQPDNAGQNMYGVVVKVIPEPGTVLLALFAVLGAIGTIRRR
jgi:hypothetical protein